MHLTTILQISNGELAMIAAKDLVSKGSGTCLSLAFIMLAVHLIIAIWNTVVMGFQFQTSSLIRVVLLILFIAFYNELMGVVMDTVNAFTSIYPEKNDILQALKQGSEAGNSHTSTFFGLDLPFDDIGSFFTWLIYCIQSGASMMVRIFIERIRILLSAFLYIAGIYAVALSTIPTFSNLVSHWFKSFLSVLFWSLTLGILDNFIVQFYQVYNNSTSSSPASDSLDWIIFNLAIIVMYLSTPALTTAYLSYSAANQVLHKLTHPVERFVNLRTNSMMNRGWNGVKNASENLGNQAKSGANYVRNRFNSGNRNQQN
jgi:hypothetical protein